VRAWGCHLHINPKSYEAALILFTPTTLEKLTGINVTPDDEIRIFDGLPEIAVKPVPNGRQAEIFGEIEDVIRNRRFRVIGDQDDQAVWLNGWSEVAKSMQKADSIDLEKLKPQYFHLDVPIRFLGQYAVPLSGDFEYYAGVAVRRQLMLAAFPGSKRLLELGCGTGLNLLLAASLFPGARLTGSDWVQPTLDILELMGQRLDRRIDGVLYNMLTGQGRDDIEIDDSTDVLTVHALEQLGEKAVDVVEWLISKRPARCLHLEPIIEFYDVEDPFDEIAARYHRTRGYLMGLLPTLEKYAAKGDIEITSRGRVKLGNLYHEAYSYISWRCL